MKKRFDLLIMLLILLMPIFDVITGLLNWHNISFPFIMLLKGIFMIGAMIYLWYKKKHRFILLSTFLFFTIYILYYYINDFSLIIEISYLIKILYFPIIAFFFANYKNEYLNKNSLTFIFILYILTYLLPGVFGFGHNLSEIYPNKSAYLGWYYAGNELTAVILCLLPIVIDTLIKSGTILYKVLIFILSIIAIYLLGTKALFLGIIIILIYFILQYIKKVNWKSKWYLTPLLFCSIFLIYKSPLVSNMQATLEHYHVDEFKYIFTIESIDNVIFSCRISFLDKVNQYYSQVDTKTKLFGIGREQIINMKDIEIDLFDIYYAIGAIGICFYLGLWFVLLSKYKLKGIYKFSFLLLFIVSFFTGHVFTSPMVSIWIAMLFYLSKEKQQNKKRILLVSNMYPSKKYKHYGSFVKNSKEILNDNYVVNKVIIRKQTNKYRKLLSYLRFYFETIIKSIFGTYDYYYVHFISHSTLPLIHISKLIKGKVILNVHGNDVVADTKRDLPNIERSKKALAIADAVIVPSTYYKKVMIENYNVKDEIIYVYPSGGVNFEVFKIIDKKEAKLKLNLNPKTTYYGYISRIEKDKGWDTLVEALHLLKEANKLNNIKVIMIGIGDEEKELDQLIKKYLLEDIIIRKEMVYQEYLVYYYNAFDLFIFPTRRKSESLGLVGLEAMASNTFVIAGDQYGPTDYCINNNNSFTFKNTSAEDLKTKIIKYQNLTEQEKKEILASALKKAQEYDRTLLKEKLIKIFDEV